jgi:hypothetical protein
MFKNVAVLFQFKSVVESNTDSLNPSQSSSLESESFLARLSDVSVKSFSMEESLAVSLAALPESPIRTLIEKNLPKVLSDTELPFFIKELLIERVPNMADVLSTMAKRDRDSLLLDRDKKSFFPRYAAASRALKANLIMHKDPAGVTFSGRSIKLFSWCQAELKETTHPIVGFLMAKLEQPAKAEAEKLFAHLADISNLLVLQITCGDDIADNIQDRNLVPFFVDIPLSDSIRAQNGARSKAESREFVSQHRDGIFLEYYDTAVALWDDAMSQLSDIFGANWESIKAEFLMLHAKVGRSLTYSILMNITPHDPDITLTTIMDNLAPNMMIECFRFLEKSLVRQISATCDISLPEEDIIRCDSIVSQSQKSASLANSTATAAREMRENDISNPIPFELNNAYMFSLKSGEDSFVANFESFLKKNKYNNHFFSHYYDTDLEEIPANFDCLSLLTLRKMALTQIVCNLTSLGFEIPSTDFVLDTLADATLAKLADAPDGTTGVAKSVLAKYKRHILLIDKFFDKVLKDTEVETRLFDIWKTDIQTMTAAATEIQEPILQAFAKDYVTSWKDFLCMYLLFKRAFDGTI